MTKENVIGINAEDNHTKGIVRIAEFLHNETSKYQLMDFLNIDRKYASDYQLGTLVSMVMRTRDWTAILDTFDIDNVRICSQCGQPMVAGVYADGEYYCSDECLDNGLGIKKYLELAKDTDEDEDCEYYYTEWE